MRDTKTSTTRSRRGSSRSMALTCGRRSSTAGAAALAGLVGGSFEVAYSNLVPVLQAYQHGVAFQIVAPSTMFRSDQLQNAMLVAKDSPLRGARDLNGKTIGTQSLQDLNSVAMRAWIDKNGGDSTTVHFLEVPSSAAVTALTQHRVDAMALSEPLLSEALARGNVRVFAKPQGAIANRFQAQGFIAMSDYVAQHPDVMARFVKAMHESAIYNNAHLADTVETRFFVYERPGRRHCPQRARRGRRVRGSALRSAVDRCRGKIRNDCARVSRREYHQPGCLEATAFGSQQRLSPWATANELLNARKESCE